MGARAGLAVAAVSEAPQRGAPRAGETKIPAGSMPMRPLGRTGVSVSMLGLGGFHIGIPKDEKQAIRLMHVALDHGVTFLDNCWDYHEGESERRMGKALKGGRRSKAFVMSKIDGRNKKAATEQIDQSLARLQTDVIDLMQIHEVIRMSDPERVFGRDGAIEALVAAKKAGKIRFIGFTGHKDPVMHLRMLEVAERNGFAFDAVQMPINVMDPHFKSFGNQVLPVLTKRGIAVLGMKPLGSGIILKSGAVSATDCLRYAMSEPTSVVITGCETMGVLEQALAVALAWKPLSDDERRVLLARTAKVAGKGQFERFKTSEDFDGTTRNPEWLERA